MEKNMKSGKSLFRLLSWAMVVVITLSLSPMFAGFGAFADLQGAPITDPSATGTTGTETTASGEDVTTTTVAEPTATGTTTESKYAILSWNITTKSYNEDQTKLIDVTFADSKQFEKGDVATMVITMCDVWGGQGELSRDPDKVKSWVELTNATLQSVKVSAASNHKPGFNNLVYTFTVDMTGNVEVTGKINHLNFNSSLVEVQDIVRTTAPTSNTATSATGDVTDPSTDNTTASTTKKEVLLGDANGDGAVDMKDVLVLRKFIAGLDVEMDETAADMNEDGAVDMKDVLALRKLIAGVK